MRLHKLEQEFGQPPTMLPSPRFLSWSKLRLFDRRLRRYPLFTACFCSLPSFVSTSTYDAM